MFGDAAPMMRTHQLVLYWQIAAVAAEDCCCKKQCFESAVMLCSRSGSVEEQHFRKASSGYCSVAVAAA